MRLLRRHPVESEYQEPPTAVQAGRAPEFGAHRPPQRLNCQRGLFSAPFPHVPADLYADVERGSATRERDRAVLQPHTRVTTNTYFGRFPASYWQRWTTVTEVGVELTVTGDCRVELFASDTNKVPRCVEVAEVCDSAGSDSAGSDSAGDVVRLTGRVDRFVDGGGMWLQLSTASTGATVQRVRWTVQRPARLRPSAVVICTYNRADECLETLRELVADPDSLDVVDAVYIVDQGTDAVASRARFTGIADALGQRLRYIRQPNLGGAGGFTRGLYEVSRVSDHADVLFMDDDVQCEPDIIIRLTAFANCASEPVIVGGQMLNLLHPTFLHVGAEYADLEGLTAGLAMPRAMDETDLLGIDERLLRNVQDERVDTAYNGWWACLLPSEVVAKVGYPLPFFFQWDDIEYGYRARRHGVATVTLPGAGLWHADFGWKDWDEWHRYFNLRNALITAALHSGFDVKRVGAVLASLIARQLVAMQYGLSATLLKAMEDFLSGPDILEDGGVGAASQIRAIRARYPETVRHPASDVPGIASHEGMIVHAAPPPHNHPAVWLKRAVSHLRGQARHPVGRIPAGDAHWWHVSLFGTAVVTDASQEGVRVRRRDRALLLRLSREAAALLRRFVAEASSVTEAYRAAAPDLASRENWARLYGFPRPTVDPGEPEEELPTTR